MTRRERTRKRAAALLTGLCALLAAILAWEIMVDPSPLDGAPPARPERAAIEAESRADAAAVRPLEDYEEILSRPLFTESRRPAERVQPAAASAGPEAGDVKLLGTVVSQAQRLAIVSYGTPPRVLVLEEGQQVTGWTIVSISPDQLVLKDGGSTREVQLKKVDQKDPIQKTAPRRRQ